VPSKRESILFKGIIEIVGDNLPQHITYAPVGSTFTPCGFLGIGIYLTNLFLPLPSNIGWKLS